MRNNDPIPPAEDSATPLIQADPILLTPNRRKLDVEYPPWYSLSRLKPPQSKPLFRGFKRPSFFRMVTLTVLCLITYPTFYILTLVAKDKSLFIVRLIVSVWCSAGGFALGYILLTIGAQHLEAATWATVIHMSYEGAGMKLRDLAKGSGNPTSFMPAFHIFRSRFGNQETSRRSRKAYDKRPWSLFLGFFVVLVTLAPLLPFIFGRIMRIETFVRNQRETYREVLITGDLSQEDVNRSTEYVGALVFIPQLWTLLPYGRSASEAVEFDYENDTVYFAQPSLSQFVPGGSGAGTFKQTELAGPKDAPNNTLELTGRNAPKGDTGAVLRYSQWGVRIHCKKLPDPEVNLVPFSSQNSTYVFIPQDFLRDLFGVYGMDLPVPFTKPNFDNIIAGDTIPSNINPSTISYCLRWGDDGQGVSLNSKAVTHPDESPREWTTVETFLIRFGELLTTSGHFPVYSDKNEWGIKIGYDAAVCVQRYEPWIIEAYKRSIVSPSVLGIVGKGNSSTSLSPSGNIRGPPIANTSRYLDAIGKRAAFYAAHDNTIVQMLKENNRAYYLPSPAAVSFTDGTGLWGYTELSPDRLAVIRARIGAANTLPYLAGSGLIVAQSYEDETVACAIYETWQLIGFPILIWILGIIGELFVPTLPLNIPRREFGVYSWLTLFQSQELQFEAADDLDKFTSLDELEEKFSDRRVKFVDLDFVDHHTSENSSVTR